MGESTAYTDLGYLDSEELRMRKKTKSRRQVEEYTSSRRSREILLLSDCVGGSLILDSNNLPSTFHVENHSILVNYAETYGYFIEVSNGVIQFICNELDNSWEPRFIEIDQCEF